MQGTEHEMELREKLLMQSEVFSINRDLKLTEQVKNQILENERNNAPRNGTLNVLPRRMMMKKEGASRMKISDYSYFLNVMEENKNPLNIMPESTRMKFFKRLIRRLMRVTLQWQQLFNNATKDAVALLAKDMNAMTWTIKGMEEKLRIQEDRITDLNMIVSKMADKHRDFQDAFDRMRDNGVGAFSPEDHEVFYKKTNAQAGEDSIMAYVFSTLGIPFKECDYLDLGANHPQFLSNTNFFYEQGARGVLVEANPDLIQSLRYYRNCDILLNRVISDKADGSLDFYILSGDGLSTPDYEAAKQAIEANPNLKIEKVIKVEPITVNEILRTYFYTAPKILNVDIEGMEMDILRGIDFNAYRPLMVIIEMIPYSPSLIVGEKNTEIMEFMRSKGYQEYAFTGINSIFIDVEQAKKLQRTR